MNTKNTNLKLLACRFSQIHSDESERVKQICTDVVFIQICVYPCYLCKSVCCFISWNSCAFVVKDKIMEQEVAQIIDANLNRAKEGLRVVEEVARFVLRNEKLTKEIKSQRNIWANLFKNQDLIKFRDTTKDLGKYKDFDDSSYRGLCETTQRNLSRAQEGCRVLEEFSKLFSKELPPKIKEIRFNIYELEKTITQLISKATEWHR